MDYSAFLNKIDDFIRRYYLNKIVRGSICLSIIFLACFLLIVVLEYFEYYPVSVKTFLFYSFIICHLILFWFLIGQFLLRYFKLGNRLSHEQAAEIIGIHFPEVSDRLTNTLQLQKLLVNYPQQEDFILAGINQRIEQLKPVPFVSAIKISQNKKYLRFVFIPLFLILIIAILWPAILTDGASRFIRHDVYFQKKMPFHIKIENKKLEAIENEDFNFKIILSGNEIPQDIYLEDGENTFKLKRETPLNFSFLFKSVRQNHTFRLKAGDFISERYTLKVLEKPLLLEIKAFLQYPSYLRKKAESVQNLTDLTVPEGTRIHWKIKGKNTQRLDFHFGDASLKVNQNEDIFSVQQLAKKSGTYKITPYNKTKGSPLSYSLNVIPDSWPGISINQRLDSANNRILYFIGNAEDDHGITRISLHYSIDKSPDPKRVNKSFIKEIAYQSSRSNFADFFYFWSLPNSGILPEEELTYYFEVKDNDGVNGPKSTRSNTYTYRLPSKEENYLKTEQAQQEIVEKLQQAGKEAKEIQQEAKKLRLESLNSSVLDYNSQKKIEELMNKQKHLDRVLEEIKKENKQLTDEYKQLTDNNLILKKQGQIQKLFDEVLDDKTRQMLQDLQKLLDKKNAGLQPQNLKNTEFNNKTLEKELDRILELYKKLELEQKLNKNIEKLRELSSQQKSNVSEQDIQKQQEIQKDFQEIKKELADLDKANEQSSSKTDFTNPKEKLNNIDNELKKAIEKLNQRNQKEAIENQKEAASQMEELANDMQQTMEGNNEEENQVNEKELRLLLKNLLQASFDQEKLMLDIKKNENNDAQLVRLGQNQRFILDALKNVEDSLFSLSKRVPQIASTVNHEINSINLQLNESLKSITERRIAEANRQQQYALTSINNMALLLSEALKQLQDAMKNARPGGKGKPQSGFGELNKMQQELNKNMQKAKEQLQKQSMQSGKSGQNGSSQEFAEMARQQQQIRQALQKLQQEMNKSGNGPRLEKTLKEMEQTEAELVNKVITEEALKRQERISIRLLEAEKAEKEREQDQQKESKAGKEFAPNYELIYKEYLKTRNKNLDMLKFLPPTLNSFYKFKNDEYFKKLNLEESR